MRNTSPYHLKLILGVAIVAAAAFFGGHIQPADAMLAIGAAGTLDVVTVGANFSGMAYAGGEGGVGRTSPPQAMMSVHRFFATADKQLGHEMDGMLRATVPPEGWADYVAHWPAAAEVVKQLEAATAQKAADAAAAKAEIEAQIRKELTASITAQVLADLKAQGQA